MVTLRSNLKASLTGILFLAAVGVASPVPTPAQQGSAVKFRTLNPPNGDFVIAAPPGWGFEENKFENPITVAPARGVGPSATIWAMIWVTGLAEDMMAPDILRRARASLNACGPMAQVMSVHTTRWNTSDALGLMVAYLRRTGQPAQLVSKRVVSGGQSMEAMLRCLTRGVPKDARLIVSMAHSPSPSYSPIVAMAHQQCPGIPVLPAWESFAFLTSCSAPAGTLATWEHVCAAIFASFHPRGNWLVAYARQFAQQMKTSAAQVDQITASIRHVGKMQLQSRLDWIASNCATGPRARDVPGPNTPLTHQQAVQHDMGLTNRQHYTEEPLA